MVATVEQLAALVRGRLVGDGSVSIRSARPVGEAGPGDITFIENERYARLLRGSPASAAIVGPHFSRRAARDAKIWPSSRSTTRSSAFLAVRTHLIGPSTIPRWTGVHPQASVAPTARIGAGCRRSIPFAYVGEDAEIGDGTTLHPGRRDRRRVPDRDGVHHPSQRRALSRGGPGRPRRDPCRDGARRRRLRIPPWPTARMSRSRTRAGSRSADDVEIGVELHDRPRDLRGHADRRGHQDRQPGHDRPQQPDRPPQPALRPGRHRRKLQDRRLRGHGRPGGDQG